MDTINCILFQNVFYGVRNFFSAGGMFSVSSSFRFGALFMAFHNGYLKFRESNKPLAQQHYTFWESAMNFSNTIIEAIEDFENSSKEQLSYVTKKMKRGVKIFQLQSDKLDTRRRISRLKRISFVYSPGSMSNF